MRSHGFDRLKRTFRENTIRPKISRHDFDVTELERFEVFAGRGVPLAVSHTGEGRVRCSNIGKVSRRDSQSTSRAGEKPAYVDLGKGAHFGERALLRDEMRACDVIALEPTACYVVSRADFNAMLGSMTEAMERCLALRVIMSMKRAAAPRKARATRATSKPRRSRVR